uniref:Uncharacterized protein n=1 Tax=Romanomermis culicivorax TaxID=13658 RepID=A0A915IRQ3_ROMCU
MEFLVVVHCGAGLYSNESREKLVKLTKRLCKSIVAEPNFDSPTVICRRGIVHLENSPSTNAGLGSNLTEEGRVECDACLMQGRDLLFAAVGAMSGVKNPIDVPFVMLEKCAIDGNFHDLTYIWIFLFF